MGLSAIRGMDVRQILSMLCCSVQLEALIRADSTKFIKGSIASDVKSESEHTVFQEKRKNNV